MKINGVFYNDLPYYRAIDNENILIIIIYLTHIILILM